MCVTLGMSPFQLMWQLEERVERAVRRALKETDGNILAFLPGKGEISACLDELRHLRSVEVLPLHGDLLTSRTGQSL